MNWSKEDYRPQFEITTADLIEEVTREKIEVRETVTDLLNAAPPLPFGHLNSDWLNFLENLEAEEPLWYFSSICVSHAGIRAEAFGYVIVRGESMGPYFIVTIRQAPS